MPLYLLCSEEGSVIDVVQAKDPDDACALFNTTPRRCIELDDMTLKQIKIMEKKNRKEQTQNADEFKILTDELVKQTIDAILELSKYIHLK